MSRIVSTLVSLVLAVILLTGNFAVNVTGQNKAQPKPRLPDHWSKVGLSAEQKGKVYKVQEEYNAKVDELEKQIDKLELERKQKLFEILTDGQKDQLRKIYLDKLGVDPFAPPKKQIEPKKNQ